MEEFDNLWNQLPDVIEYLDFDCYNNIVPHYAHKHIIFGTITYIQVVDKDDMMTEDWDNHFPLFENEWDENNEFDNSKIVILPLSNQMKLAKQRLEDLKIQGVIKY